MLTDKMVKRIREYALNQHITETNLSVDDAIALLSKGQWDDMEGGVITPWYMYEDTPAIEVYEMVVDMIDSLTKICGELMELAKEEK